VTLAPAATQTLLPERVELTESRRRLYEAATTLFSQRGYYGVSVRDIANSIGLQSGAIYAHVASKEQLLFEILKIGIEEYRDQMRAALLDAGREPTDQVATLVRAHVLINMQYPALARIINRDVACLTPEHLNHIVAIRFDAETLMLEILDRGIKLGAFTAEDPQLLVTAIAGMGLHIAELWTPDHRLSMDALADQCAEMALHLLERRED
jgi:AcrR family transcriptional regulator